MVGQLKKNSHKGSEIARNTFKELLKASESGRWKERDMDMIQDGYREEIG